MNNKERVAAFLGSATTTTAAAAGFSHMAGDDQSEAVTVAVHAHALKPSMHHELHLEAQYRNLFLSHFSAAKRKASGMGFPL